MEKKTSEGKSPEEEDRLYLPVGLRKHQEKKSEQNFKLFEGESGKLGGLGGVDGRNLLRRCTHRISLLVQGQKKKDAQRVNKQRTRKNLKGGDQRRKVVGSVQW